MNTISKNIKRFRQKKGWSQREVAEQLNISIPAFSKIENGITDINLKRLGQIAVLLEASIMDLMATDGENPQSKHSMHVNMLKIKLAKKEEEVIDLQRRVIELYEEVRLKNKKP
ncbi:transcriptional regulator with XRE-family HTH domain [Pedobacter sp. AK017]|uniref:helix-turn-helix domain-containing protein n=1 Tax=Pedobacter sp. AK017 TaxID=2723073 RepID=UPI00160C7386|nr:helix-turn-helix transcriptional regulator [Pedobacter sp. AK017]MBB5439647.1 transcriptional regulator with XRE-family HTH domain [Pedobacter sp. AK017]